MLLYYGMICEILLLAWPKLQCFIMPLQKSANIRDVSSRTGPHLPFLKTCNAMRTFSLQRSSKFVSFDSSSYFKFLISYRCIYFIFCIYFLSSKLMFGLYIRTQQKLSISRSVTFSLAPCSIYHCTCTINLINLFMSIRTHRKTDTKMIWTNLYEESTNSYLTKSGHADKLLLLRLLFVSRDTITRRLVKVIALHPATSYLM